MRWLLHVTTPPPQATLAGGAPVRRLVQGHASGAPLLCCQVSGQRSRVLRVLLLLALHLCSHMPGARLSSTQCMEVNLPTPVPAP